MELWMFMMSDLGYQKRIAEYSLKSLKEIKRHINRHKYPERYELVLKEIEKRENVEKEFFVEDPNVPKGCKLYRINDDYKLIIDNKKIKKDRFLVIFLSLFGLIWIPVTLLVTLIVLFGEYNLFLICWGLFAWFGSVGIVRTLYGLSEKEIYVINHEAFIPSIPMNGFLFMGNNRKIPLNTITRITLDQGDQSDKDSVFSIRIWHHHKSKEKQLIVGYFLHPDDKHKVFKLLKEILTKKNGSVKSTNRYYTFTDTTETDHDGKIEKAVGSATIEFTLPEDLISKIPKNISYMTGPDSLKIHYNNAGAKASVNFMFIWCSGIMILMSGLIYGVFSSGSYDMAIILSIVLTAIEIFGVYHLLGLLFTKTELAFSKSGLTLSKKLLRKRKTKKVYYDDIKRIRQVIEAGAGYVNSNHRGLIIETGENIQIVKDQDEANVHWLGQAIEAMTQKKFVVDRD